MKQISFGISVSSQYEEILICVGGLFWYEAQHGKLVVEQWVSYVLEHMEQRGKHPSSDQEEFVKAIRVARLLQEVGGQKALDAYLHALSRKNSHKKKIV